ncbi:MAG TPA: glycosyltransferase [Fimbriimonadaceae bacterium]|nr:glycosyltransferase [Fimbriimonadaceae bacterium]HRJ97156.1 glycosyltransferase [Fimbriimonadaceae bacterium]
MPRVSILLTCYNHLAYLPTCWQSIADQTYRDFEVIALDDGSTDGTREWLSDREGEAKIVFNEANLGTYGTLNRGLELATGELIAILNDDDVWLPTKLERQIALLDRFPRVGLVHTDGYFIDGPGNRIEGSPLGFEFPRTETGDVFLDLVYQNKIIASAALVRRECFEELGGFDDSYFGSGDWQMWLRIAERWEIGYVAEPLTLYRVHGENASHKLERIWRDDQRLREWLVPRLSAATAHDPARLSRAKAHNWACLGTVRKLNGDPKGARAAFSASLREQPGRVKSALRWAATFLPRSAFRRLR